jgi:hypothetical protein
MKEGKKRALSLALAALAVSSMVTVAISGEFGPASPTGEAEGISFVPEIVERNLAAGAGPITTMGDLSGNSVPEPVIAAEKNETKSNIIQTFATQRQNNEILMDSYSNYLQDTQQVGTLVGMNEYVRALNNESSEAQARNKAKQAVLDYYAKKEIQRNKQWGTNVESLVTAVQKARQSNISQQTSSGFIYANGEATESDYNFEKAELVDGNHTRQVTLVNGTNVEIASPRFNVQIRQTFSDQQLVTDTLSFDPYKGFSGQVNGQRPVEITTWKTKSTAETSGARLIYTPDWTMQEQITNQTTELEQRMDNIVNATYSGYQSGQINDSDLISPLQLSRNYSPDADSEYGTYTLATLTSMGKSAPTNLSNTRTMNITANGTDYRGILLSDGLPPGGSFNLSETYNTTDLTGEQLIQTSNGLVTIDDDRENVTGADFTVTAVEGPDGEKLNQSSIGYTNPRYETTDISDYKQTMEELREIQAQINARQANLSSGGGGGGFLSGDLFGGFGNGGIALIALAGGALILLMGSGGSGGGTVINQGRNKDD